MIHGFFAFDDFLLSSSKETSFILLTAVSTNEYKSRENYYRYRKNLTAGYEYYLVTLLVSSGYRNKPSVKSTRTVRFPRFESRHRT